MPHWIGGIIMEKTMNVANDLGNGSIKMTLDGDFFLAPSVIANEPEQEITAPVEFDNADQQQQYMVNFLNQMDVTISSSVVKRQGRFLIA